LPTSLLNGDKKLATDLVRKPRSDGIIANVEARCKGIGKYRTNWIIPAALSSNKSKSLHEFGIHGKRHMSQFSVKDPLVAKNGSTNAMNERLQQSNTVHEKNSRAKLENVEATLGNGNFSNKFLSSNKNEPGFFTLICTNLKDGDWQIKTIADISGQPTLNIANSGYKADARNRNRSMRNDILNIIEGKGLIGQVYSNIKYIFQHFRVTIRSRSISELYSYILQNSFALNEPIVNVASNSTVFFARKDSKSRIRKKIEEFYRKKPFKKGQSKTDNICHQRKKCSKERKDTCEKKKQMPCGKKERPCQEKRKTVCCTETKQKKTVCESTCDSEKKDCHTPKEKVSCTDKKVPPCTQPKDCKDSQSTLDYDAESCRQNAYQIGTPDVCKTKEPSKSDQPCTKPKTETCTSTVKTSDQPCTKPKTEKTSDQPCTKPKTETCTSTVKTSDQPCTKPKTETCAKSKEQDCDKPCTKPKTETCAKSREQNCDKPCIKLKTETCTKSREQNCDKPCIKLKTETSTVNDKPCTKPKTETCKSILDTCNEKKQCTEPKTTCKEVPKVCHETKKNCYQDKKEVEDCTKPKDKCPPVIRAPDCSGNDGKKKDWKYSATTYNGASLQRLFKRHGFKAFLDKR